jgi:hypothetical protein
MNTNELQKRLQLLWDNSDDFRIYKNTNTESSVHILGLMVLYRYAEPEFNTLLESDESIIAEKTNQVFRQFEANHLDCFHALSGVLDFRGLYLNENCGLKALINNVHELIVWLSLQNNNENNISNNNNAIIAFLSKLSEDFLVTETLGNLIASLSEPLSKESIYDPFCSLGNLLYDATLNSDDNLIFGQSTSKITALFSLLSLLLCGHNNINLSLSNALELPAFTTPTKRLKQFDLVISCPDVTMQVEPDKYDSYSRFEFGIPAKGKLDALLLQHIVKSIKADTGRAIAVVPQGFLYRGGVEKEVRQSFIDTNLLAAVITLPAKLFAAKSNLPPMVLLFFKAKRSSTDIMFINADRLITSNKSSGVDQDFIDSVLNAYHRHDTDMDISRFSSPVTIKQIREQDYNLSINRYVTPSVNLEYSIDDEKQRHNLLTKLNVIQADIENAITGFRI